MKKNTIKVLSALFISLFLVTACKNNSATKISLKDAVTAAENAQTKISGISINSDTTSKAVRDEASPLLEGAVSKTESAYSVIGEGKEAVEKAVKNIKAALKNDTAAGADAEKRAMEGMAKALVDALKAAKEKSKE